MEILNIKAKNINQIEPNKKIFEEIKEQKIGLITTIQYVNSLTKFKEILPNSIIGGQILGCKIENAKKIEPEIDIFLYIGTGKFHPLAVAYNLKKKVLIYNPLDNKLTKISNEEITKYQKKKNAKLSYFLNSTNIGILISTKPGQEKLKEAKKLTDNIKKNYAEKQVYFLISDMITPYECENFPFIDCFINTACPRIIEDDFKKPIINYEDVTELLKNLK
jgi:2-(3-amino-3-carboxypropyl)histidine synthase